MTQDVLLPSKQVVDTISSIYPFQDVMTFGEVITGAVCSVIVYTGTDGNPSLILSGTPNFSSSGGLSVTQNLTAGLSGVIYQIVCTVVTSLSNTFVKNAYLAVINSVNEY